MQKKAHIFLNLLFIILFLTALSGKGIAQDAPSEVIHAAEDGLHHFLSLIPHGTMEDYGFNKGDSPDQACLGKPFKLYTITPDSLFKYKPEGSIYSIMSETTNWYFPIVLENNTKTILVVAKANNEWKAVTLGYAALGRELAKIRQMWPKSKGYNPLLIGIFQAKEFMFTVPEKDAYNLTQITCKYRTNKEVSGQKGLSMNLSKNGLNYSTLEKLSNVIERLKPIVEENLRENQ